jgi:hypothetical protein
MALMDILKTFTALCLVSLAAAGCGAKHVVLDKDPASWTSEIVVRGIGFDDKGLPIIGAALARRPSRSGDRFSLVRLADGLPLISYDIAVVSQKPDFAKPFRTVYEWTGKGFTLGADATGAWADSVMRAQAHNRDEAAVQLALLAAPVTLGTVGGFVVGLVDGIRQTALEMGKVVVNGEEAITCTTYEYDALGRLMFMRMLTPDRDQELVQTEFWYEGAGTVPVRAMVRSLVEGKEREIK